MLKLVALSEGYTGRSHQLTVDRTTVGRVDGNSFTIPEPSVSSHHCEVLLKGSDVVIKDLNSTNGTFINGKRVTEDVLKPGQILRLGQVEMKLEAAGASAPATTATTSRKPVDQTMVIQQEAIRTQIIEGPKGALPTSKGFSKKTNSVNRWFIIGGIILGLIIIGLLIFVVNHAKSGG